MQDLRNVAGRVAGLGIDGYAHQVIAGAVDQIAVGIDLEIATAGVIGDAGEDRHVVDHGARLLHREEAVAIDCHVGGNRRGRYGALGGDGGLGEGGDAAGNLAARRRCVGNEILEAGADALVAGGRGVRDVARDVLEREGLRLQAADGSVQCVKDTHDIVSKFDPGGQPIRKTRAAIAGEIRKGYAKPENPFISYG